jgi:hypothetical protein
MMSPHHTVIASRLRWNSIQDIISRDWERDGRRKRQTCKMITTETDDRRVFPDGSTSFKRPFSHVWGYIDIFRYTRMYSASNSRKEVTKAITIVLK